MPKFDSAYSKKVYSNSMIEMLLEDSKYYIARFPMRTTDRTKKNISTKIQLSKEEKEEIEKEGVVQRGYTKQISTRINFYNYSTEKDTGKQLHTIKINVGKYPSTYFMYIDKESYLNVQKQFKDRSFIQGSNKDYTIEEINPYYLKKILKDESVEGGIPRKIQKKRKNSKEEEDTEVVIKGIKPRLISIAELVDIISNTQRKAPDKKEPERKKETIKVKAPDKKGQEKNKDAIKVKGEEIDVDKKASEFFLSSKITDLQTGEDTEAEENIKLLNKIVAVHKQIQDVKNQAQKVVTSTKTKEKEPEKKIEKASLDDYLEQRKDVLNKIRDVEEKTKSIQAVSKKLLSLSPSQKQSDNVEKDPEKIQDPIEKLKAYQERKKELEKDLKDIDDKIKKFKSKSDEINDIEKIQDPIEKLKAYQEIKKDLIAELVKKIKKYTQYKKVNDAVVEYIIHGRISKEYPSLYTNILRTYKESEAVQELSSTGTGAQAIPGSGEGMATKYAFKPTKSLTVSRKNKKILDSKNYGRLKEEANFIFLETYRGYIKNKKP